MTDNTAAHEQYQVGYGHAIAGRTRMLPSDPKLAQPYNAGYQAGQAERPTPLNGHATATELSQQHSGRVTDAEAKIILGIRQWAMDLITRTKPSMNAPDQIIAARQIEEYLMRGTTPEAKR